VFRRDEFGFPTYWTLQIAGWSAFLVLVLLCILPYLKEPGTLRGNVVSVLAMFVCSCLLRPVCRSLKERIPSLLALEVRALLWCIPAGAVSGFVCEWAALGQRLAYSGWIVASVQNAVVLFLWCSLYFSIKQAQQSARERERLLRAEAEVRDARLSALRHQLNPHFLFNSLNAVSTLILEGDAPAATRMLSQIGELLRTSLNGEVVSEMPLAQEVAFTERYLAIEQTRLGRRLRVEMSIAPETLDALVPSMLLQPLVENAVRHGIAPRLEGGVIRIQSDVQRDRLRILVRNTGVACEKVPLKDLSANGIGLSNTAERLKTLYAGDHTFELKWPADGGCEVTVEVPFRQTAPEPCGLPAQEVVACAR
jgi:two-component system, LytTR family, sensor kinase